MKTIRVSLCLQLFIVLAACAAADNAGKCPPQSNSECAKKAAAPRRAVPRSAERPLASPTPPPSAAPIIVPPHDVAAPPAPTVGSCDAGGCWDTGGNRYNGGANGTFLNGSGRQCQRVGTTMQCF